MIPYIVLITAWFLLVESLVSIFYRGRKLKKNGWDVTDRQKIEFSGRILRFVIGSYLLLHLSSITLGMMNWAGYLVSAEATVAIATRLPDLESSGITFTQKIEFSGRLMRGIIGLLYLVLGLYIA